MAANTLTRPQSPSMPPTSNAGIAPAQTIAWVGSICASISYFFSRAIRLPIHGTLLTCASHRAWWPRSLQSSTCMTPTYSKTLRVHVERGRLDSRLNSQIALPMFKCHFLWRSLTTHRVQKTRMSSCRTSITCFFVLSVCICADTSSIACFQQRHCQGRPLCS